MFGRKKAKMKNSEAAMENASSSAKSKTSNCGAKAKCGTCGKKKSSAKASK